ncbi:hypothetical protein BKA69DRAFT_941614 [Paraphysoderma sedebokerense]|nr:hypothetical protein BKA69DRAFT_941614 [Paraphysoderma sedebokerense]
MEQAGTESESCVGFTISNSVLLQEMKESSLYDDFKHSVTLLRQVNIDGLNTDERLCFFLNVRNLLIMHSCIEHEPPSSLYQRLTYTGPSYNIGGEYYSTNEITSGILRATLSIPSILGINVLPFANFNPRDRRYKYRIDSEHPILNFVLPDGTKTSPRIVVYHLHKLHDQLKKEAIQYIDTEFEYIPKKKRVMMPQYFSWFVYLVLFFLFSPRKMLIGDFGNRYYKDFGYYPSDVLLWIFQNLPDCKLSNLMVSQDLIKQDTKNSIIRVSRKLSVKYINCPVEFGFKLAV